MFIWTTGAYPHMALSGAERLTAWLSLQFSQSGTWTVLGTYKVPVLEVTIYYQHQKASPSHRAMAVLFLTLPHLLRLPIYSVLIQDVGFA